MADSDSSSLTDLSSPPPTDDEMAELEAPLKATKPAPQRKKKTNGTILSFFKSPSPVRKKRPASPPHEMVPEDNPDIPFIVMFRSRFAEAFPPKTPTFGPQDLERGVAEVVPSPQVETLLCCLLALLLNRKKPVEKGHYGRALEEAISTHRTQWPAAWNGINPIGSNRNFNTMTATERLTLLKTLVLWSLHDSEVVNNMIKESYKHRTSKEKGDTNIDLSVQPWGRDGDKRRYWLIEGKDDTPFRVYRESNPTLKNNTWWSVAGSIDEIRSLAQKLEDDDGTREAKQLAERIRNAIPRFEATEEKRKRREYRHIRKTALAQPVFSLYEGRTRGKRMKYTFSDEEDEINEALGVRRSGRASGRDTPAQHTGPTVTASGRQVRSRATGMYGESLLSGQTDAPSPATGDYTRSEASEEPHAGHGRATRGNRPTNGYALERKRAGNYVDDMDDEDITSWDGNEDEDDEPEKMELDDDDDEASAEDNSEAEEPKSLIVTLRYRKDAQIGTKEPSSKPEDVTMPDRPEQQNDLSGEVQISGAPLEPVPVVAPQPTFQPTLEALPQPAISAPVIVQAPHEAEVPIPHHPSPKKEYAMPQPKIEPAFSAPTPPYIASENADPDAKQYPAVQPEAHIPFQPNNTSLPPPTPASSYQ